MLQTAGVNPTINSIFYRQNDNFFQPRVSVSLVQNKVSLNVFIPCCLSDGKNICISGGVSAQPGIRDGVVFSVIQEMIEWIDKNLDQDLSVKNLSKKSGYSVWHFQRKFTQLVGLRVSHYIRIRRVINSVVDLIKSDKGILEIAVANGFNCQASFTRTVRRITGYTPGKIRSRFKDTNDEWVKIIEDIVTPHAGVSTA